ncbi:MAG: NYN domain-containing protein [Synergistaceae bacterium]|nr:NYN domain-containing protein [Synergistota bacterium]NLM72025.1 NYN domain-containing protein [Synergistaceae bacterium]
MEYIGIFIDGGYLQKIAFQMSPRIRIDVARLVQWIACDLAVRRVYYYDCLPYQSPEPTCEERERVSKKQKFFNAIERLDRCEVRLGKLEKRGEDESGRPMFDQKGVDLRMGLDFVFASLKQRIDYAALVTGDSDLCPAVEAAKNEGIITRLVHGPFGTYHNQLWGIVDERREITPAVLGALELTR